MDELRSIRRLKAGDPGGLDMLVTRYQRKAVKTAFLITHDEQLAEEIVQETFVRIYQNISRFDETRPFEPYLLRSVVNTALSGMEKSDRWVQFGAGSNVDAVAELLEEAISVEDQADAAWQRQELFSAMSQLTARQRAAIVQRYYLDMSEAEMSASLAAAPGTIKSLLHAARQRLRGLLGSERSAE